METRSSGKSDHHIIKPGKTLSASGSGSGRHQRFSEPDPALLSEFSKKTEVYQKDVEEFFYLRRSTVTQTLQAMEKNGLIRRSSVARDARLKKLELTEAGQALEAQIHTRVMQMEQRLRESLTEEEITQFLSITDNAWSRIDKPWSTGNQASL